MYSYQITPHQLQFEKPAKTSRNVFDTRQIYLVKITDKTTGKSGVGEAAPLALLSIDDVPNYEQILNEKLQQFCETNDVRELDLANFPSIHFGIETALLDLAADSEGRMYQTPFTQGKQSISVNGLVWMSDSETMYAEALEKIAAGYNVIKFKVGALDFDEECRMLEKIRKQFSAFQVTLRLDANGAFHTEDAAQQLADLSRFEIHSIEQPVQAGEWDTMAKLCAESSIPIALDEELIGQGVGQRFNMLRLLKPDYIILKPNLLGGVNQANEWIAIANKLDIGWWATSALESNVGLNAIAQWASTYSPVLHQGLGTGGLFANNFETKLELAKGEMRYKV
jgi:o-succinylbenzoate synthase